MSDAVAEIEAKIRALSPKAKVELVRSLIAELDGPPDGGVDQAWLEEAQRRHSEIASGAVKAVPGEQVLKNLHARLNK